jgi:thiosulfate/3-mercaptopyruvate sulfurtransferase
MANETVQWHEPSNQLVSVEKLAARLADPQWRVIDTRFDLSDTDAGMESYRASHIPGALYAHLDRDLAGPVARGTGRHPLPEVAVWQHTVRAWGIGPDTRVVAYDDAGGAIAARLWWMLRWAGHPTAAVLDGGWQAWIRAGLPVESGRVRVDPAGFTARIQPDRCVETEDMVNFLHGGGRLFDARAAERYRGDIEPIDAAAGHVPGAISAPFSCNLAGNGRFRPPRELRRIYDARLGGIAAADTVTMCGSGVTACHNLLAMEIAGLGAGRLYVGSWSGWISDPGRPIARGPDPGDMVKTC